jgi:uncharacterized protein
MKKIKKIFISAIHQNAGKTTLSLGLYKTFKEHNLRTAFMKPVGQEFVMADDLAVDKDSYLIGEVYRTRKRLRDMSPVTIGRGYTEKYIFNPQKENLQNKILKSFNSLIKGKDVIICEGTGHAGVGSVIDCSNADVAALLGCKALIVSGGGIGRSIDEIILNKALFDLHNVEVLGVIVNKVRPEKYDKIRTALEAGLKNKGIRLLGVIPDTPILSAPTVEQIMQRLELKLFCGGENITSRVKHTIVAAMEPHNMIGHLKDGTLVITSGDRVDNILVSVSSHLVHEGSGSRISGVILTGGLIPDAKIVNLLKESKIPVLFCDSDTYTIAAKIENLTFKIQKTDKDKIKEAMRLVKGHVDVDMILENL